MAAAVLADNARLPGRAVVLRETAAQHPAAGAGTGVSVRSCSACVEKAEALASARRLNDSHTLSELSFVDILILIRPNCASSCHVFCIGGATTSARARARRARVRPCPPTPPGQAPSPGRTKWRAAAAPPTPHPTTQRTPRLPSSCDEVTDVFPWCSDGSLQMAKAAEAHGIPLMPFFEAGMRATAAHHYHVRDRCNEATPGDFVAAAGLVGAGGRCDWCGFYISLDDLPRTFSLAAQALLLPGVTALLRCVLSRG